MKNRNFLILFTFCLAFCRQICAQTENSKDFAHGDIIHSNNGLLMEASFDKSAGAYDILIAGVFQKTENGAVADPRIGRNPFVKEGVCQVKFNSEGGVIKKGDLVTSSSQPGVAMKAAKSGMVLGVALEDSNGAEGLIKIRVLIQYVKQ